MQDTNYKKVVSIILQDPNLRLNVIKSTESNLTALYQSLLQVDNTDGNSLMSQIDNDPDILITPIDDHHVVYDYIYDYCIGRNAHPKYQNLWNDHLISSTVKLQGLGEKGDIIRSDQRYLLNLQSNCFSFNQLFMVLVDEDFDVGDFKYLLYSVIARGELLKFQKLNETYDGVDEYPGILDIALRYGRYELIEYMFDKLKIAESLSDYGKIMEFENYINSHRYIYYQTLELADRDLGKIACGKQDYERSIKKVMTYYSYPITVETLAIWCDMIKHKTYEWDIVPLEVIMLIKSYISDAIPLTQDFGEFNQLIFGNDWSSRAFLVSLYMELQDKYQFEKEKVEKLRHEITNLRIKNECLENRITLMSRHRKRFDTE